MYKLIIQMSIYLRTGIDFLMRMNLHDLKELIKEVAEIERKQRIQTSNKNRR